MLTFLVFYLSIESYIKTVYRPATGKLVYCQSYKANKRPLHSKYNCILWH